MNGKGFLKGFLLVLIGIGILYGAWMIMPPSDTNYEYTVKAEQVNEDEMVEEAIDYENISEAEQEVLFDAFKKSDHFLGGAEAVIETDEPIENVSNEWRVIEIQGVPLLVAIQGPEEVTRSTKFVRDLLSIIVGTVGLIWTLCAVLAWKDLTIYGELQE